MKTEHVISSSGGNDSVALIQWAHEQSLDNVIVVYCNTGWAKPGWSRRIIDVSRLVVKYGFLPIEAQSIGMAALVSIKSAFPASGMQFCTTHLKMVPFLEKVDETDPTRQATVLIGKRRAESDARKNTPEFIEASEVHGGRRVWHPLYLHTDEQRNQLLVRADFDVLPYRSKECSPCVNANRSDFLGLSAGEIERVNDLEVKLGKPMFRPKRFNAVGIHGVIKWAKDGRDRGSIEDEDAECASLFGCGL